MKITGAAPEWALNRLAQSKIAFWKVKWIDSVTVQIYIFRKDTAKVETEIQRVMCEADVLRTFGLQEKLKTVLLRPVLLIMVVLSFGFVFFLSQFVVFYEVTGNETIPDAMILRALDTLGVGFGTYGPSIKPKVIKDHMLNLLPQLQWITITQNGCRAVVVVRERTETPEIESRKGFGDIIASRSGIITQQYVYSGQALYEVGDAVLKGEVLVSGAVDLDRMILLQKANAEIFALTGYESTVKIPAQYGQKVYTGEEMTSVWLTIGEKRIKIFGNSGISTANCDKMIETIHLTLPEGLELPVWVSVEKLLPYEQQPGTLQEATAQLLLQTYTERGVRASMRAGEILHTQYELTLQNGCYVLRSELECQEMIALPLEADWTKED